MGAISVPAFSLVAALITDRIDILLAGLSLGPILGAAVGAVACAGR